MKILAIQFKSLGDAVLLIPALNCLRRRYPACELHVAVSQAAAPLLERQPSLTRIWAIRRDGSRGSWRQFWPVVRALRAERFDGSVDFAGNDRGAILSFLCGARERLGAPGAGGFFGRRWCYTRRIPPAPRHQHETLRLAYVLSAWGLEPPAGVEIALRPDPALAATAVRLLPPRTVLCFTGGGISKKLWPPGHWAATYQWAKAAGCPLAFMGGIQPFEQRLLSELKRLVPEAPVLPRLDLPTVLAVLQRARAVISSDTGPLHFAAGLGVPTIGLFGPTSVLRWAPAGDCHQLVNGSTCTCAPAAHACHSAVHCLARIQPAEVIHRLQLLLSQFADSEPPALPQSGRRPPALALVDAGPGAARLE